MTIQDGSSVRVSQDIRKAIQESPESLAVLAKRYGINPKTVAKWKKRAGVGDLPSGRKPGLSSKLSAEEENIAVQFREHTLLPLDDCLYALQARMPHLTRSSLHRCFQRHGISRLARTVEGDGEDTATETAIGQVYIDKAEVQSTDGRDYLFNAIDQASKFVVVKIMAGDGTADAAEFLDYLTATVPFRIDQVHTPDVEPFTSSNGPASFSGLCSQRGIEHHFRSAIHPRQGSSADSVSRMIHQDAIFSSRAYLADMLRDFVYAYNCRRRLKTLGGCTPFEYLCRVWEREPDRFVRRPHHELVGPEIVTA